MNPCPARGLRLAKGLAPVLLLASCALGPDFVAPPAPKGERIVAAPSPQELSVGDSAQRFDRNADVPARWWTSLGSPELDALVDRSLLQNPTLAAANASLRQSEDTLRAGYGVFFPQIGASVATTRQQSVLALGGAPVKVGPYSLATDTASVSYVLDIFGGERRTVEALVAQRDAQRFAALAAYLALTGNVVNTSVARAGYRAQEGALRDIVRMQEDQIRIAQVQFDAGTSAYSAVVALQSQKAANEAAVAALEQRIDQSTHLLMQLGGDAPGDARIAEISLESLQLPAEIPDALPSALARHRPDILQAEAQLHRDSALIGVATADLFPTLSLGGSGGLSHAAIADVFSSGTKVWSAQAQLAGSVFSGFSGVYERRAAIDAYDESLALYRQTLLAALTQVADTVTALGHDAQALRAQAESRAAAEEGLKLARTNYEAGTAGYLDLLNADAQYQQARLAYIGALAQRLQDTVALYVALGGGWWHQGSESQAQSKG